MIVPFWLRDSTPSALWDSMTSIDSALTGDPWAGTWTVYASGGIQSYQFDVWPRNSEIRTLGDCYRLAGVEFQNDPEGVSRTHQIPNSVGKVTTISSGGYDQYSRHSHLPLLNHPTFVGEPIAWPYCAMTNEQPSLVEKLVVVGGHIGLLDSRLTPEKCENVAQRVYPQ